MKTVTLKIGNMRKAVEWVIYPGDGCKEIKIQSDNRIAIINRDTRECILSKHRQSGAYSEHLLVENGATTITLSESIVDEIIENQPKRGDVLEGGFVILA